MNKKGISTVVATVLIVLITVAAVTILWASISPLINRDMSQETACLDVEGKYSVDTNIQYSNWKASTNEINVRVKNNGDESADSVRLIVSVDGETINNSKISNIDGTGGSVVEIISYDKLVSDTSKVTASVAPVIIVDGEERVCRATVEVNIREADS
jgi:uncharacterized protein YpmB